MGKVISINGTEIGVKEYRGQRVVTFKDIDAVHGRPEGTARRNFAMNKERFIEGEDYFVVTPADLENTELYENRTNGIEVNSPRGMALITEQGYLMLVKSFTDDLAWEVQRKLVSSYFRVRSLADDLSPQMRMLYGMLDQMAEAERQAREAKQIAERAVETTEAIRDAVNPVTENWREEINKKINRIQKACGSEFANLRSEMYKELDRRGGFDMEQRLQNRKERMRAEGCSKTSIEKMNRMDIIESDKRMREIFTKIVSEYEIKYCA